MVKSKEEVMMFVSQERCREIGHTQHNSPDSNTTLSLSMSFLIPTYPFIPLSPSSILPTRYLRPALTASQFHSTYTLLLSSISLSVCEKSHCSISLSTHSIPSISLSSPSYPCLTFSPLLRTNDKTNRSLFLPSIQYFGLSSYSLCCSEC